MHSQSRLQSSDAKLHLLRPGRPLRGRLALASVASACANREPTRAGPVRRCTTPKCVLVAPPIANNLSFYSNSIDQIGCIARMVASRRLSAATLLLCCMVAAVLVTGCEAKTKHKKSMENWLRWHDKYLARTQLNVALKRRSLLQADTSEAPAPAPPTGPPLTLPKNALEVKGRIHGHLEIKPHEVLPAVRCGRDVIAAHAMDGRHVCIRMGCTIWGYVTNYVVCPPLRGRLFARRL